MKSDVLRGHIDMMILYFLLEETAHGYLIRKMIISRTNNALMIKETSLYSSLRRLEKNKHLKSLITIDKENKRSRREYTVTELGKKYYKELTREWDSSKNIINLFVRSDYY